MYAGQVVERPGQKITQFPAHPYTQLLLSAAPTRTAPPRLAGSGAPHRA
jgi:peptide/nickel transport system ATP-binding protein